MSSLNAKEKAGRISIPSLWGIGVAAPVFPSFEVDILDRVPDDQKPEAVWHRDRARAIIKAHPEVTELFGTWAWTSVFCVAAAGLQLGLAKGLLVEELIWVPDGPAETAEQASAADQQMQRPGGPLQMKVIQIMDPVLERVVDELIWVPGASTDTKG